MQTVKHQTVRQLGAFLKNEYNSDYCRTSGTFTNDTDAAVQLQPGILFTGDAAAPAIFDTANAADVIGVCITSELVQPGATVPVTTLTAGPAILNTNEMDFPADPAQVATIETALKGLLFKLTKGLPV